MSAFLEIEFSVVAFEVLFAFCAGWYLRTWYQQEKEFYETRNMDAAGDKGLRGAV